MRTEQNILPMNLKLAYAMPAFALAMVGIPVYVFIPKFYTDVVGVDIAVVGFLLFGVRIFDAITDPMMGWWSDRIRTAMGRRRPFILFGALLLAVGVFFLFRPPMAAEAWTSSVWFAFWIYAVFLFWTVTAVPYESLGPELSRHYDDRTTLFILRDGFLIGGTLVAAASPAMVRWAWGLDGSPEEERTAFLIMGLLYAPALVGACAWCVYRLRERRPLPDAACIRLSESLRGMWRNRPFLILLAAFTVSALGSNLPAALILYYVQYVLRTSGAELFLLLFFITGIAFLPLWRRVAGRLGKKHAWLISLGVNAIVSLMIFFLGPGDVVAYGVLVVVSGVGFGAVLALPSALQADVIDYDELITGQRREGQYMGLWSVAKKMTAAVGVGVGLAAMGMAGYVPNAIQGPSVEWTIRIFYALIPSLCNVAAIAIALRYPLSGQRHREVIAAIDHIRAGGAAADPLRPGVLVCRDRMACVI